MLSNLSRLLSGPAYGLSTLGFHAALKRTHLPLCFRECSRNASQVPPAEASFKPSTPRPVFRLHGVGGFRGELRSPRRIVDLPLLTGVLAFALRIWKLCVFGSSVLSRSGLLCSHGRYVLMLAMERPLYPSYHSTHSSLLFSSSH